MRDSRSERTRLTRMYLLWAVLVAAAPVAGAGAGEDGGKAASYDLTVLVYAPEAGPAQVAMSYPKVVDRTAIKKGLGDLARRTDARISGVRISDGQQARGLAEVGTAVEFTASGLVEATRGALPVGPMIRSLPEWQHVRLAFMVGEGFPWTGPGATTADGFSVRLLSSMQPYEYDVERKSGRLAPPVGAAEKRPRSRALAPALVMGLVAGFAIGWLATGERERIRPRSSRR